MGVLGAAASLTASQWTSQDSIRGDVSVGSFSLVISEEDLAFEQLVPGEPQVSLHTLSNNSTTQADVRLTTEAIPKEVDFDVTIYDDNAAYLSGDSRQTFGADEILSMDVGEFVAVAITAEVDSSAEAMGRTFEGLTFTFTGTQVIDADTAPSG